MSLRQMVRECFINNTNDVDRFDALSKLRKESKARDALSEEPDPDRIDDIFTTEAIKIRLEREGKYESSTDKQHPEPVQQPEPREPEQVQELPKLQAKDEQELSRRANYSREPVPEGLTKSGTRKTGAAGGRSIVDGIL